LLYDLMHTQNPSKEISNYFNTLTTGIFFVNRLLVNRLFILFCIALMSHYVINMHGHLVSPINQISAHVQAGG